MSYPAAEFDRIFKSKPEDTLCTECGIILTDKEKEAQREICFECYIAHYPL